MVIINGTYLIGCLIDINYKLFITFPARDKYSFKVIQVFMNYIGLAKMNSIFFFRLMFSEL